MNTFNYRGITIDASTKQLTEPSTSQNMPQTNNHASVTKNNNNNKQSRNFFPQKEQAIVINGIKAIHPGKKTNYTSSTSNIIKCISLYCTQNN